MSRSAQDCSTRRFDRLVATLLAALAAVVSLGGCQTDAGATWPAFGTYRLPYADGTQVYVSNDFATHSPVGRYDLVGQGAGPHQIVAAADGWVRFIVDSNTGSGTGDNNYVWIEHPYPFCQEPGVTWPGKPADYDQTCIPCLGDFCNEWSKASHMSPDSVSVDAGLSEGDWVPAGTFIGYEDDIGHANGVHEHWEIAKLDPDQPLSNYPNGWTHDWSGDGWVGSPNLLPWICGIGHLTDGDTHEAAPCPEMSEAPSTRFALKLRARSSFGRLDRARGAAAELSVSGPDEGGRVTVHGLSLSQPLKVHLGQEGWLPWPIGTEIEVRKLSLVRPFTFELGRFGSARFPAHHMVLSAEIIVSEPGASPMRTRLDGPIFGNVRVRLTRDSLRFVIDGGLLGRLVASGRPSKAAHPQR